MNRIRVAARQSWPWLAVLALAAWAAADVSGETRADAAERVRSMYEAYRESDFPDVPDLSAARALERADSLRIVDVREGREREISGIAGAMDLAAWREVRARGDRLPVLVYCTIGVRSAEVTRGLREEGVVAFNLAGGILAWAHAGGEVIEPGTGAPTRRVHVYGRRWSLLPDGWRGVW